MVIPHSLAIGLRRARWDLKLRQIKMSYAVFNSTTKTTCLVDRGQTLVPHLKSTRTSSFGDKCEPKLFSDTDDQGVKVFL